MQNLNFFLVHFPLPDDIIQTFREIDSQYPDIFIQQPSGKRRFFSIQDRKDYPFYNAEMLSNLKRKIADKMGLDYDDYVEVRDSIGINDPGVGIGPHVDVIERQHITLDQSNPKKVRIAQDWIRTNPERKHPSQIRDFVQMRCNLFVIEPEKGQHAWLEDKVLEIPRGGYGAAFDSGKVHGTTPGSTKKMTISLGYLVRRETFNQLVEENVDKNHKIYVDERYMRGQYAD